MPAFGLAYLFREDELFTIYLKSAIDLMEAEVKSTADDDRDAQETMDTDPVLSEDIPESSIEPEVDDSLDADEWRRYL